MNVLEFILSLMAIILVPLLVFGVPIAVIVGLLVSIFSYVCCSADEKEKRRKYKKAIIIFGILFGVMAAAVGVLIYYLSVTPITFM
ncbi:MAG: hypothetical protein IJ035_03970 [Oscillospiraceae bacterium]|nr:hypothetical protein [Oscillospiraceae bacterium]